MKWPLVFFVVAAIAAVFGFSGISEAFADTAIILFLVAAALFVLSIFLGGGRRSAGGILSGLGGLAVLVAVAFTAVWFSDRYSLETAGAELDETLAEARLTLDDVAREFPAVTNEIDEVVDDTRDAFTPEEDLLDDKDDVPAIAPNKGAQPQK